MNTDAKPKPKRLDWRVREQRSQTVIKELESRLVERTAQLEAANQELEAFSYSVSHDLRAPLRSIQGFGQALIEDHGLDLSEAGLGYLRRMTRAAERMDEMMQELLAYSRLGRAELHRQ